MPRIRMLRILTETYEDLLYARAHHPKAYVREKAALLVKIAEGMPAAQAARAVHGLVERAPDTVYSWMDAVEADGIEGLVVKPGRGRKPAFSPSPSDAGQRCC